MLEDQYIEFESLIRILRTRDLDEAEWARLGQLSEYDPFLAEAVEGLRSVPYEVRIKHLESIWARLAKDKPGRRRTLSVPLWLSAAATILVLIGVFWVIRPWSSPGNEQFAHDSSVNTYKETPGSPSGLEAPTEEGQAGASPAVADSRNSASEESGTSVSDIDRTKREAANADQPAGANAQAADAPSAGIILAESDETAESGADAVMQESRKIVGSSDLQALSSRPTFLAPEVKGVVLDRRGSPLHGVDVQLKGTLTGTQTDYQGNFALDIPERHRQNALVFSYKDYPTLETDVAEGDSLIVRLQDMATAQDQAVTTYAQGKSKAQRPGTRSMAKPAVGEKSYTKYIRQNLKHPDTASEAGIHGTVVLEFDIATDGTPHNFTVIQSLGYGCDEEAIRLIREGPKWDAQSSQVSIGRWEIEF